MVQWETFEARPAVTPRWKQLSDFIAGQIEAGTLRPGEQLPAERRLAEMVELSVPTVRQALDDLRGRGLVETGHGTGTFIRLGPVGLALG